MFFECSSFGDISFPESVEKIEDNAFMGCAFKKINFPSNLKYIGKRAFYRNVKLKKIVIPDTVMEVSNNAFGECYELEDVVIGKKLDNISQCCFYGCFNLKKIEAIIMSVGEDMEQLEPSYVAAL